MDREYVKRREMLDRQLTECMPLIEIERSAYIKAEFGRIQSVMGTSYWNQDMDVQEIFHGEAGDELLPIEKQVKDPYDVTIEELDWMPKQYKRIERRGTETYMGFFRMMSEDQERICLLARIWHKLTHETLCADLEIKELKEGHEAFLKRKLYDSVVVIR